MIRHAYLKSDLLDPIHTKQHQRIDEREPVQSVSGEHSRKSAIGSNPVLSTTYGVSIFSKRTSINVSLFNRLRGYGTRRLPDSLWQTCVNQTNRGHREIPTKRGVGPRPDSRWPINHEHTGSLITPCTVDIDSRLATAWIAQRLRLIAN